MELLWREVSLRVTDESVCQELLAAILNCGGACLRSFVEDMGDMQPRYLWEALEVWVM